MTIKMRRRREAGFLIFGIASMLSVSFSEERGTDNLIILNDLVETVTTRNHQLETIPGPEIREIVNEYFSEATVPEATAMNVLTYLSDIYSEHGYYETGNWSKNIFRSSIVPPARLPEFDFNNFVWPVKGKLTSYYGYRPKFGRFHHGIDLSLNYGDTVVCAFPGVVTTTGYEEGGYGRYVVVSHSGGIETLYGHLNINIVSPGKTLKAGDAVGIGGSTGNATGPHLHFETRYRGVPVNPFYWLDAPSNLTRNE